MRLLGAFFIEEDYENRFLFYDPIHDRMDLRFGPHEHLGGLAPGKEFDVLENGAWMPARLCKGYHWYLEGIHVSNLNGLIVRLYPE